MTVTAHLIGYPRIGPERELKWALERARDGRIEGAAFDRQVAELRRPDPGGEGGWIGSAVDDYFLYDEGLETALMFGIVPGGGGAPVEPDPFAVLSPAAPGPPGEKRGR